MEQVLDLLNLAVQLRIGSAPGLVARLAQRAPDPECLDLPVQGQEALDLPDLRWKERRKRQLFKHYPFS